MNEPLYKIADKYRSLLEDDDISAEDFSLQMDAIEDAFEHKIESCVLYELDLKAQEDMLEAEIKRLKERKDALYFKAQRMRRYIQFNMTRVNKLKLKTALVTVSVVQGRERLMVDDVTKVPDEFVVIERHPLKAEIKKFLEHGNALPGCHIERGEPFLLVR